MKIRIFDAKSGKFHSAPKVANSHFPFAIFYLRFVIGFRSNPQQWQIKKRQ